MDFGSGGRDGYCEDEQMMMIKGKFPFSSSSSSSSSPHHQYKGLVVPLPEAQIYSNQQRRGCWLGNRFDTTTTQDDITCRSYDNGGGGGISSGTGSTPKFELMSRDSERNEDNITGSGSGEALGNSGGSGGGIGMVEKEHMFDKVVTPSDVGKLNRLVIPKQHAEKYFPLDSSTNEKGLLLNFEDRSGKPWRFRYSYWNSSQSYVMTKGWSRFVKEKKLDAGDIVSFQRGVGDLGKDHFYIDWRRRPNIAPPDTSMLPNFSLPHNFPFHHHRSIPWSPLFYRAPPSAAGHSAPQHHHQQQQQNNINFHPYRNNNHHYNSNNNNNINIHNSNFNGMNQCPTGSIIYLRSATTVPLQQQQQEDDVIMMQESGNGGGDEAGMVFDSVPVVHGKAAGKRLRLFGVNMECANSEELDEECVTLSSSTATNTNTTNMSSMVSSSSPHFLPPNLQSSRLYNGYPIQTEFLNKGKQQSSRSLDFKI